MKTKSFEDPLHGRQPIKKVTHPIKVECVGPDHPQPVEGVQPEHHHQAAHDDAPCVSGVRA